MVDREFSCQHCGTFETRTPIQEEPPRVCPTCGEPVHQIFHTATVIWKGRLRWMKFNPDWDWEKETYGNL